MASAYTQNPDWSTAVYTADPSITDSWTQLDFSDVIDDAGRYLVFFIAEQYDAGNGSPNPCIRPSGIANNFLNNQGRAAGADNCAIYYIGNQLLIATVTDDASCVDVRTRAANGLKLYLVGWLPWTMATGTVFADAAFPTSFTDLDISGTLAGEHFCAFIVNRTNTSQNIYGIRRNGATGEIQNDSTHGSENCSADATASSAMIFMPTDASGVVEHRQDASSGLTGSVELYGYAPNYTAVNEVVYGPALFPGASGSWNDIDLSAWVGKRNVVALLKVERAGAYGDYYSAFRPNGVTVNVRNGGPGDGSALGCASTHDRGLGTTPQISPYALVPTDSNGVIEWMSNYTSDNYTITLEGYLDVEPDSSVTAKSTPFTKTLEVSLDLSAGAATYDLATAVGGDVLVQGVSLYVSTAGASLTSLSIQTNQTNATTILTAAEGAVASLTAQKNLAYAFNRFPFRLAAGQKIQWTVVGTGTGVVKAVVAYQAATLGTGARLSA